MSSGTDGPNITNPIPDETQTAPTASSNYEVQSLQNDTGVIANDPLQSPELSQPQYENSEIVQQSLNEMDMAAQPRHSAVPADDYVNTAPNAKVAQPYENGNSISTVV